MKKIMFFALLMLNVSFAQLAFDRTRVIFDHNASNSVSVIVENTNPKMPYLAQSWIEDENGNKIEEPLVALPILQRLNPLQEKQIKINLIGNAQSLPKDRESLLYFNVLGVPPTDDVAQSKLNILIKSSLKLFYRPKGLPRYEDNGWFEEMKVNKSGNTLTLENPTAYHIIIYGFNSKKGGKIIEKDVILKPFSSETVQVNIGSTPHIYFINDHGLAKVQSYNCQGNTCQLVK